MEKFILKSDLDWIKEYDSIDNYCNIYGFKSKNFKDYINKFNKTNYMINLNENTNEFNKLLEKTKQWGYLNTCYLKKFPKLIENKKILDVGMGQGPYAILYKSLGAKSYIGVDPSINYKESKIRDYRLGAGKYKKDIDYDTLSDKEKKELKTIDDGGSWYHDFGYTAKDIMNIIPDVKLYNSIIEDCDDLIDDNSQDLVMLHCVSEHLNQLSKVIEYCWKYTNSHGKIFLSHGNYYSWAGHHQVPRDPKGYKIDNKKHNLYIDWKHLHPLNLAYHNQSLNRVRLIDLKNLIEKYYIIEYWEETGDKTVTDRLSGEIRNNWENYTLSEMLTNCPKLIGRKREIPLDYEIDNSLYYHPKQEIENSISNYILDNNFSNEELYIKKYKPEFLNLEFNKNELSIKINYEETELNCKKIKSCGLHFYIAESLMKDNTEYTFSFDVKSNNKQSLDTKLRIYTGYEWITFKEGLSNDYKLFKIKKPFKINTKSKYRIGFYNCLDMDIAIKNVKFALSNI